MYPYLQYAALIGVVTFAQSAPLTLTQHRINEIAGKCFNAQYAMSGLKGSKKPGETAEQFSARVKGYLAALDEADNALRPLKQNPALIHVAPDNEKIWKGIVANVAILERDVVEAHNAWSATAKEGERAKLGQKLLQSLNTLQAVLARLRDAKP